MFKLKPVLFFIFSIISLFLFSQYSLAGGGPIEFKLNYNHSQLPGSTYTLTLTAYDPTKPSTVIGYCANCQIKVYLEDFEIRDVIVQSSSKTNSKGQITASVTSKIPGPRTVYAKLTLPNGQSQNSQRIVLPYSGISPIHPKSGPISWQTRQVTLSAQHFFLIHNGERYTLNSLNKDQVKEVSSSYADPNKTTLNVGWFEKGKYLNLIFEFAKNANKWDVTRIKIAELTQFPTSYTEFKPVPIGNPLRKGFEQDMLLLTTTTPTDLIRFEGLYIYPFLLSDQHIVITDSFVPYCGSTSCGDTVTDIINGRNLGEQVKVEAIGMDNNEHYTEDRLNSSGNPYVQVVGRTGTTQMIVDFHGLPCNQLYKVRLTHALREEEFFEQELVLFPAHYCGAFRG